MDKNIVIISGAASGLGFELAKQLIEKGYFVVNIDKNEKQTKAVDKLFEKSGNYISFVGDVADEKFVIESL